MLIGWRAITTILTRRRRTSSRHRAEAFARLRGANPNRGRFRSTTRRSHELVRLGTGWAPSRSDAGNGPVRSWRPMRSRGDRRFMSRSCFYESPSFSKQLLVPQNPTDLRVRPPLRRVRPLLRRVQERLGTLQSSKLPQGLWPFLPGVYDPNSFFQAFYIGLGLQSHNFCFNPKLRTSEILSAISVIFKFALNKEMHGFKPRETRQKQGQAKANQHR